MQGFSCKTCEIFKSIFFYRIPPVVSCGTNSISQLASILIIDRLRNINIHGFHVFDLKDWILWLVNKVNWKVLWEFNMHLIYKASQIATRKVCRLFFPFFLSNKCGRWFIVIYFCLSFHFWLIWQHALGFCSILKGNKAYQARLSHLIFFLIWLNIC